jgi:hypothetical protein
MNRIKSFKNFQKINELTEFNLQRFNNSPIASAVHVDNPQLSVNAFDKHEDNIRVAMSRITDIMYNLKGTSSFSSLKGSLLLEEQDIEKIKIQRILKEDSIKYDVFLTLTIKENEYWGIIKDILNVEPKLKSEVFRDNNLIQNKEWVIKTKGLIIKTIKEWLKPLPGKYKLLNEEVICYSSELGKQYKFKKGTIIDLIRSYEDRIVVNFDGSNYNLKNDNYVYFNWWFEKLD